MVWCVGKNTPSVFPAKKISSRQVCCFPQNIKALRLRPGLPGLSVSGGMSARFPRSYVDLNRLRGPRHRCRCVADISAHDVSGPAARKLMRMPKIRNIHVFSPTLSTLKGPLTCVYGVAVHPKCVPGRCEGVRHLSNLRHRKAGLT